MQKSNKTIENKKSKFAFDDLFNSKDDKVKEFAKMNERNNKIHPLFLTELTDLPQPKYGYEKQLDKNGELKAYLIKIKSPDYDPTLKKSDRNTPYDTITLVQYINAFIDRKNLKQPSKTNPEKQVRMSVSTFISNAFKKRNFSIINDLANLLDESFGGKEDIEDIEEQIKKKLAKVEAIIARDREDIYNELAKPVVKQAKKIIKEKAVSKKAKKL